MRCLLLFCILTACGSKGSESTASSAAAISTDRSIFSDWALAIPNSDAALIYALADVSQAQVTPGFEKSFDDIVVNKRLNLSELKSGKNALSHWYDAGACFWRSEFSVSVYESGQIIITKERKKTNLVNCPTPDSAESLYYKYSIESGRLTVCGYDDAGFTLQRGCVNSN